MFRSLLIANRGEIALRVMRTARRLGLHSIAVYSDADRNAPHVRAADEAVYLGASAPRTSYLDMDKLLEVAADAVHPGYGFLSENAHFAERVQASGRVWVGPPPSAMRLLGDKQSARRLARELGLPVLPGYDGDDQSEAAFESAAQGTGYPLLVKAAAGGGGRGMRLVRDAAQLGAALATARSEAVQAFGDGRLLLEKAVEGGRHVEVQIFADSQGNCVHIGERDCSVQRRHQKLIEESPSPAVSAAARERLGQAATGIARAAGYAGAGTVEFLLDADGQFWFLEVNTRLQVEHPVTELVTGLDLVEWQLRVAAGEPLPMRQDQIYFRGHAVEARLCAEDPARNHLPQTGRLALWRAPDGVRTDHALEAGLEVTPHYDSLLAKVIARAPTRAEALARLAAALDATLALGVATNRGLLSAVLRSAEFAARGATTAFLDDFRATSTPSEAWSAAALAAVITTEAAARAAGFGEQTAWSNNPERVQRRRLRRGGGVEEVALKHERGEYSVELHEVTLKLRVLALAPQAATVEFAGLGQETVPYCMDGSVIHLAFLRRDWIFEDVGALPPEKRRAGSSTELRAPMNGRVIALQARAGETLEAGRPLVVLEAMKMEHALDLPFALTVTAVHVQPGAQVAPGQLLVEFEAAAPQS